MVQSSIIVDFINVSIRHGECSDVIKLFELFLYISFGKETQLLIFVQCQRLNYLEKFGKGDVEMAHSFYS